MKSVPENRFVKSLDLVIDFATIGEYRIVSSPPRRELAADDFWANDIEWVQLPRDRDIACRLPRARDRNSAVARIRP